MVSMAESNVFQGPGSEALREKSCGGRCSGETEALPEDKLMEYMKALPAWKLNDPKTEMRRTLTAKNFIAAVDFINGLRDVAEEEGHHPDVHITNYRDVEVVVTTHAINALSIHDVVLAAKIDAIEVVYSPKWLKLQTQELQA